MQQAEREERKETDLFLVASELCQEAQQVQEPSTHLPTAPIQHPAVSAAVPHTQEQHQDLPSTPTFLTLQFGTEGVTSISRKVRNATEHQGQLWMSPT